METNQPAENLNRGKQPTPILNLLRVGGVVIVLALIGAFVIYYASDYRSRNTSLSTASLQGISRDSQGGIDDVQEGKRLTLEAVKAHAAYRQAGVQKKPQALAILQNTLGRRKAHMSVLAETNPQEFLKMVLPREIRNTMPTGLSDEIESEVTLEGTLQILHEDYFEPQKSKLFHYLDSRDGRFLLSSPKQFPRATGGIAARISGFKLGQSIVLPTTEKENFELLEPIPPEVPFQSSLMKEKLQSIVRGILGIRVAQASHTSLATAQKVLVILINFTDDTSQPFTAAQAASFVNNNVNSYFTENSYGKMPISADAVGWYTVPLTSSCQTLSTYLAEAVKAADSDVYFPDYSHILLSYPGNCGYAGAAYIGHSLWGGWSSWSTDPAPVISVAGVKSLYFQDLRVNGHELSHSILGQYHANARDCGTKVTGSDAECTNIEYGDKFDILGAYAPSPSSPYHLSGRHKPIDWFGTGEYTEIMTDGTYTLNPFESPSSANKVYYTWKRGTPPIYLEFRQPIGFDAGIPLNVQEGLLTRYSNYAGTGDAQALDNTPETTSWLDPALGVGKTLVDFFSGVTIKVLSKTSSALTFTVAFPPTTCIQANPTVDISPTSQWGSPGTPLSYTVSATNNDNSLCSSSTFNLAYSVPAGWSAALSNSSLLLSPGTSGSTTITVTSPTTAADGFYDFSVTATNSTNSSLVGSGSATYVVSTADTEPPSVTITSPLDGSSVAKKTTVTISATALDNVGVSKVEFYVNNSLQCTDSTAPHTCNWNVPTAPRKSYKLQAKAYDAAGNSGTSSIVTVTSK